MDSLPVTDSITIPSEELVWRFEVSGGPGGQHANRSATRAVLSFDLAASSVFSEEVKRKMVDRLGNRVRAGVVTLAEGSARSQWRNRQVVRRRLVEVLVEAMRIEHPRKETKPRAEARRRRLEDKRRLGEKKRLRRPPKSE